MDQSEASLTSDIKSEADSDRELVPDLESIKGSQGSSKGPLVGPGRGPVDPIKGSPKLEHPKPDAVDPNDSPDIPAPSIKEESVLSERSAVSRPESQGIKPKVIQSPTSVKEFLFKAFLKGTL